MKQLKFICVQPDDDYYLWQVHLWLESLKNIGHSDKAIVLVFTPIFREKNDKWKMIVDLYPEATFYFYKDDLNINNLIHLYIPILRPYTLWKYFEEHPELSEDAIFYCDSDIIFTEKFNVDEFIQDDVCYLSDTNHYINAKYFDSKERDVLPEKLEEYKKRDILGELTEAIGISREIAEKYNDHSGGAQYLLKNIDAEFWKKVFNNTIYIRQYLLAVNKEFFKNENTGFQSWCSDMWGVLWNIWFREQETKVIPELEFAWATDPIEKLDRCSILHNAGVTSKTINGIPYFYKGEYHMGSDPTKDSHLDVVLNNEESKKKCTWYYANKLKELKNKYNLNY